MANWRSLIVLLRLAAEEVVGLVARAYFNGKAKAEERWLVQRHAAYESYLRHVPRRVL